MLTKKPCSVPYCLMLNRPARQAGWVFPGILVG
jgi:hypothetical protein